MTSAAATKPIARPPGEPATQPKRDPNLARILELGVPVSVILAERPMPVETILQITVGTILEFDVPFGSDLSLVVGNRTMGRGQAVKIGEHFGLRITEIDSVRHRIEAMGPEDAAR